MMATDILDAVYGCLIAGAIGDALGAPVEGLYWTEIREKYGKVTELMPGITLEEILQTMAHHTSYLMRRAIDLTMDLAYASSTVDEFAEKYYAAMLDWTWP